MTTLEIRPQPGPQEKFLSTSADIAFYGGAAGGGKSFAILMEACRNVGVRGYGGIIFRKTSGEVKGEGGLWEDAWKIFPHVGGVPKVASLRWIFPQNGSSISFGYMEHEQDVKKQSGKQYAFIGFDELTHFTSHQFWFMLSRNRSTCGVKPYLRATCNPDPDSFVAELIDWWIGEDGFYIPERSGVIRWFLRINNELIWAGEKEWFEENGYHKSDGYEPISFTFIGAKLEDNQILMKSDPSYRSKLMAMTRVERERLLFGNWKIRPASGLYFKERFFEVVDRIPDDVRYWVRAWDRAATREDEAGADDPDWTAAPRFAMTKDRMIYITDLIHFRGSSFEVEKSILQVANADGKKTTVALFQDPGSAGKGEAQAMVRKLGGFRTKVVKATKNKITFAGQYSSQCEGGTIKVLRAPWNRKFFRQHENFPDGKHDDIVDGCSLAFDIIIRPRPYMA